jgi:hypothetical protein
MILIQNPKESQEQFIKRCLDANEEVECYPKDTKPFRLSPVKEDTTMLNYICVKDYLPIRKGEVFRRHAGDMWVSTTTNRKMTDSAIRANKEYFELEIKIV